MKTIIYSIFLSLSFNVSAGISIIADLDDTIKIINSGNYVTITYHALVKNRFFAGMPLFLEEAQTYSDEFYIVSGSPNFIRKKVVSSLEGQGIKYESVILKSFKELLESKYDFKLRRIQELIETSENDVILLGDDVSHDPDVYDTIQKAYPDRVLAVYIHVIKNRPLPETLIPHWTSFDLAVHEFKAGRMNLDSVHKIYETLMAEEEMNLIIPGFAHCPKSNDPWSWMNDSEFAQEASLISERIIDHCLP